MINRLSLFFVLLFSLSLSFAQVTLIVDAIPGNTPAGDNIHAAGTFNSWDPGSSAYILQSLGSGKYAINLGNQSQTISYKFTRGAWASVEGNANGNVRPNRSFTPTGGVDTVYHQILSWEDLGGGGGGSTANAGVRVMSNAFPMPQFNTTRRIWVYLPADYDTSNKNYPVLYMHDAQNLFDAQTSFAGEWEVDETLRQLEQAGDYGVIVIGIENSPNRINELTPWSNPTYGGGDGDKYVRFIVESLKPHVDSSYRTLPGRETTGIAGSSLGGLISYYAGMAYQEVFGKVGVFSPSFWFSNNVYAFTNNTGKKEEGRFYFVGGANEGSNMAMNMQTIYNDLRGLGFPANDLNLQIKADGQHSEWFWAREFGPAYQWLFGNLSLSANDLQGSPRIQMYPNPADKWLDIRSPGAAEVAIYDEKGVCVSRYSISGERRLDVSRLPAGVYMLEVRHKRQTIRRKLVKL